MKFLNHKKNGFTLIEMMVAVFVFSVVMVLSTGAIFSIVSANKTSQALKSVMDNLSSALDSMSREIRYGTVYHCGSSGSSSVPQSCADSDNDTFVFVNKDGNSFRYHFKLDTSSTGFIERCNGNGTNCTRLTAPEVKIQNVHFYVKGAQPNEASQSLLLITISGYAQAGSNQSKFNIETMVSQRTANLCKDDNIVPAIYKTGLSCPQI